MMSDTGAPRARRAAAARAVASWCWRSCAPFRRRGRPAAWFSILCAAGCARRRRRSRGAATPAPMPLRAGLGRGCPPSGVAIATSASSPTRSPRHAVPGHARRVPRAVLLARIPARRAAAGARTLLRLSVALRVLDDGPRARAEPPAAVHLLGAGRPLLVPADRLLVSEAGSRARGRQGVLDDESRRRRPADRHRDAVAARRARSI